jgi:hypothetical protein
MPPAPDFLIAGALHDVDEPRGPKAEILWRGSPVFHERNTGYATFFWGERRGARRSAACSGFAKPPARERHSSILLAPPGNSCIPPDHAGRTLFPLRSLGHGCRGALARLPYPLPLAEG